MAEIIRVDGEILSKIAKFTKEFGAGRENCQLSPSHIAVNIEKYWSQWQFFD